MYGITSKMDNKHKSSMEFLWFLFIYFNSIFNLDLSFDWEDISKI